MAGLPGSRGTGSRGVTGSTWKALSRERCWPRSQQRRSPAPQNLSAPLGNLGGLTASQNSSTVIVDPLDPNKVVTRLDGLRSGAGSTLSGQQRYRGGLFDRWGQALDSIPCGARKRRWHSRRTHLIDPNTPNCVPYLETTNPTDEF